MKNHVLVMREVDRNIYNDLLSGAKTIETRAATEKYRVIKAGDTITFKCGNDRVVKTVERAEHFRSLEEMFDHFPMQDILPNAKNIEDARATYYSFPSYKVKLADYGIIALVLS